MDSTPSTSTTTPPSRRSRKRACDQCAAKHCLCILQCSADDDVRIPCARCHDKGLPCSVTSSRPDLSTPCPSPREKHDDSDLDAFLQNLSPTCPPLNEEPLPVPSELVLPSQDSQDGGGITEGHNSGGMIEGHDMLQQPRGVGPQSSSDMSRDPTASADIDLLQTVLLENDWFPATTVASTQEYGMFWQPSFQANAQPFCHFNPPSSFQFNLNPNVATSFTVTVTTNGNNTNPNNSNSLDFPINVNFSQGHHYPTFW